VISLPIRQCNLLQQAISTTPSPPPSPSGAKPHDPVVVLTGRRLPYSDIIMLPPIPRLDDYNISPEHGFLPSELPLQHLPHQIYDRWERIINNFQPLLLSKRLRTVIDRLPIIPAVHLETEAEWRRAYTVLIFLAHGYIWGGEKPSEVSITLSSLYEPQLMIRSVYHRLSHILCCRSAST